MAYSIEVKESVRERLKRGEQVKQISEQTGISTTTIYNWKKQWNKEERTKIAAQKEKQKLEKPYKRVSQEEIQTSKKIKKLIRLRKFEEAIRLTEKYPKNPVIQSQMIAIDIQEGNLKEAKKKGTREAFINDPVIQSQMVTIEKLLGDKKQGRESGVKIEKDKEVQADILKQNIKRIEGEKVVLKESTRIETEPIVAKEKENVVSKKRQNTDQVRNTMGEKQRKFREAIEVKKEIKVNASQERNGVNHYKEIIEYLEEKRKILGSEINESMKNRVSLNLNH